ncbi:hypothetical protein C4K32_3907 [Pseudomonas chlororaphis subsp. piscium]|nr:hypothetical protein C4K32_3907 [Pseudomonas chlororaphis subsp. piscium]
MAEMGFRKAQGELVEISFVQKAAYETARSLNQLLMGLPPQLAPQLAALSDPWEVERQLTAAFRQRLNEAAQVFSDDFGFALGESITICALIGAHSAGIVIEFRLPSAIVSHTNVSTKRGSTHCTGSEPALLAMA